MIKVWEKYIFKEFIKLFALFLGGFYFLYMVIDYSSHMQNYLQGKGVTFFNVAIYYVFQFVKRADILLPLALLVSAIKVLCQLNNHRELLAFQSAGIRLKKLIRPIFVMGWVCSLTILAINQYVVPFSLNYIDRFFDANLKHSFRGKQSQPIHVVHLDDHSKLFYHYYDSSKEAFFDVIWARSPNDLWKMKYLKADIDHPQGEWADHLVRGSDGNFEKTQSFPSIIFQDLKWKSDLPEKGYIPFENHSITHLWNLWRHDHLLSSTQRQEVTTQLLFKLAMPLSALLVILAIAPFCVAFTRNLQQFYIYTFGIFGFIALVAFLDATVILGESSTLSPLFGIVFPFIMLLSFFGWRFSRI